MENIQNWVALSSGAEGYEVAANLFNAFTRLGNVAQDISTVVNLFA